ncbi:MAG: SDR family oxidoreductase [Planctomycetota bacterium]
MGATPDAPAANVTPPNTDWLGLAGKVVLVTGVKNKKSVAWHIVRDLEAAGAVPLLVVRNDERRAEIAKLAGDRPVYTCDAREQESIDALAAALQRDGRHLHGFVHSIAFANYSEGMKAFHETNRADFLDATNVSAFSLIALSRALKPLLADDGAVVAISISTTTMASENYGYMAPVKAALDSAIVFLAKSFSATSKVRFNGVRAGLLKTSASAGIPGYVDSWLHAEKATLRKRGLDTAEVASTAVFLLSPRSSGINAQGLVVDAGMGSNFFDEGLLRPDSN